MTVDISALLLPMLILMAYGPWQCSFPWYLWALAVLCFGVRVFNFTWPWRKKT